LTGLDVLGNVWTVEELRVWERCAAVSRVGEVDDWHTALSTLDLDQKGHRDDVDVGVGAVCRQ
jgi:hypothetical protein